MDVLTLFWNIWTNPQTKIDEIAKYLLMMSDSSSLTWSAHVRILLVEAKIHWVLGMPLFLLNFFFVYNHNSGF